MNALIDLIAGLYTDADRVAQLDDYGRQIAANEVLLKKRRASGGPVAHIEERIAWYASRVAALREEQGESDGGTGGAGAEDVPANLGRGEGDPQEHRRPRGGHPRAA